MMPGPKSVYFMKDTIPNAYNTCNQLVKISKDVGVDPDESIDLFFLKKVGKILENHDMNIPKEIRKSAVNVFALDYFDKNRILCMGDVNPMRFSGDIFGFTDKNVRSHGEYSFVFFPSMDDRETREQISGGEYKPDGMIFYIKGNMIDSNFLYLTQETLSRNSGYFSGLEMGEKTEPFNCDLNDPQILAHEIYVIGHKSILNFIENKITEKWPEDSRRKINENLDRILEKETLDITNYIEKAKDMMKRYEEKPNIYTG